MACKLPAYPGQQLSRPCDAHRSILARHERNSMTLNNYDQQYTHQPQATSVYEASSATEHLLSEEATFSQGDQGYVGPRTPLEETLANTWAQVLEIERVGISDDFFDLG